MTTTGDRLARTAALAERVVMGLSSGTSFDGVDAALVRISGHGDAIDVELSHFLCVPYEAELRSRVADARVASVPELARLNVDIGRAFADAALALSEASGVPLSGVHLIGSHGQTVYHEPPDGARGGATLQLGEADVISRTTGITTVADFRTADVAAGGSGAPLVPLFDWLLFRRAGEAQILLNIGGIANITYVVEDLESVVAFDTGPGNALLDELVREATGDADAIDAGGRMALSGAPSEAAAERFLEGDYFSIRPPKSTGKETFGREAALELADLVYPGRDVAGLDYGELSDLLATAARVTARSVKMGAAFLPDAPAIARLAVSGGGARNAAVMRDLRDQFAPCPVVGMSELGMDPDAKEAIAFAVLADRTLQGLPGNVPAATGASFAAVLGKISPAP
jgi:anhydro-N-acetylmuramic acid kinase